MSRGRVTTMSAEGDFLTFETNNVVLWCKGRRSLGDTILKVDRI